MSEAGTPRRLTPRAEELLRAPDSDRVAHIKKRVFISHTRVREIHAAMEDLLIHPPVERMPNILVVGPSNSGKTELLKEFSRRHPPEERLNEEALYAPVIYVQAPPGPDEDMLLTSLLKKLRIAPRQGAKHGEKVDLVGETLVKVRNKILLLDELNSIIAGSIAKQGLVLNTLKYISNDTKISIVASGTKNALLALKTDPELESRFPPMLLPRWEGPTKEYRQLLASFEATLPLRFEPNLASLAKASLIFGLTDATTGGAAELIRACAIEAIEDKSEVITEDTIRLVAKRKRPDPGELERI
jgi:Cdc6-like AAA superfamily ATPase